MRYELSYFLNNYENIIVPNILGMYKLKKSFLLTTNTKQSIPSN